MSRPSESLRNISKVQREIALNVILILRSTLKNQVSSAASSRSPPRPPSPSEAGDPSPLYTIAAMPAPPRSIPPGGALTRPAGPLTVAARQAQNSPGVRHARKILAGLLVSVRFAFVAYIFFSLDNGGRWSIRERLPAVSEYRGMSRTGRPQLAPGCKVRPDGPESDPGSPLPGGIAFLSAPPSFPFPCVSVRRRM